MIEEGWRPHPERRKNESWLDLSSTGLQKLSGSDGGVVSVHLMSPSPILSFVSEVKTASGWRWKEFSHLLHREPWASLIEDRAPRVGVGGQQQPRAGNSSARCWSPRPGSRSVSGWRAEILLAGLGPSHLLRCGPVPFQRCGNSDAKSEGSHGGLSQAWEPRFPSRTHSRALLHACTHAEHENPVPTTAPGLLIVHMGVCMCTYARVHAGCWGGRPSSHPGPALSKVLLFPSSTVLGVSEPLFLTFSPPDK